MKKLLVVFFLAISSFAFAAKIEIAKSGITFEAPDGFKAVGREIIDVKWPNKNAPKWVVGNERATTTIAYDLKDNDISSYAIKDLLPTFEQMMNRAIPGIKWIEKTTIEQAGEEWLYLEMTSNAIDTDIYNMMLLTSFNKKMLIFNFNSTKEDIKKYKSQLKKSIDSIKLPTKS